MGVRLWTEPLKRVMKLPRSTRKANWLRFCIDATDGSNQDGRLCGPVRSPRLDDWDSGLSLVSRDNVGAVTAVRSNLLP